MTNPQPWAGNTKLARCCHGACPLAAYNQRAEKKGTHVHPYGVSIELISLTRGEPVWKAVGITDADGNLVNMPVYGSIEGYPVDAGDRFKLVVVYETQRRNRLTPWPACSYFTPRKAQAPGTNRQSIE